MGLKQLIKQWRRFLVVILMTSTFVVAVRAQCDSYGLRNTFDDDGGWQLYTFTESDECLVCFFGMSGQSEAELVLPCWDKYQRRISRIIVSYLFRRPRIGGSETPLSSISSNTICEMEATFNRLPRNTSTESVDHDETETIAINVEQDDYSYHLKASGISPNSFICLINVEYNCGPGLCTSDYTPVCGSNGQTYSNLCHFKIAACDAPDLVLVHEGECEPECGSNFCPFTYRPICGSDGQTYDNLCHLTNAACDAPDLVQLHEGECIPYCGPGGCTSDYTPVCGSDGQTYINLCYLTIAACDDPDLVLVHDGECKLVVTSPSNNETINITINASTTSQTALSQCQLDIPNSLNVRSLNDSKGDGYIEDGFVQEGDYISLTCLSGFVSTGQTFKCEGNGTFSPTPECRSSNMVALPLWIWMIVSFGTIGILGCGILIARKIFSHLCQHELKEAKGKDLKLTIATNGTTSVPVRENQAETYQRHIYNDGTYDQVGSPKDVTSTLPNISHTYFERKGINTNSCGRPVYSAKNHETKMSDRSIYSGHIYH